MRLIILSLTQPEKERKQQLARDCVNLAKQIQDDKQMTFAIAGILTAANKFIGREYANFIKEWMSMTYVSMLYEEEKIEAVNAMQYQVKCQVAIDMLREGDDMSKVMRITKLTRAQIEQAWEEANAVAV
jgi:ADP-ribosylglycohydrolase